MRFGRPACSFIGGRECTGRQAGVFYGKRMRFFQPAQPLGNCFNKTKTAKKSRRPPVASRCGTPTIQVGPTLDSWIAENHQEIPQNNQLSNYPTNFWIVGRVPVSIPDPHSPLALWERAGPTLFASVPRAARLLQPTARVH